jgi:cell wall-associated NlpC family hydrolase
MALLSSGCHARKAPQPVAWYPTLAGIEFTIQAGAFGDVENAIRLAQSLEQAGVEAFHFVDQDGLHKVRFGSFPSRAQAVQRANGLRVEALIEDYLVVATRSAGWQERIGLRGDIARSAMSFLGRPYRWGGADTAFDCSGLTMTAYRLHGLGLPRSSAEQFSLGQPVAAERLREADLVFFAIEARDSATHVGLYVGEGRFIHAPGRGKVVRVDHLSDDYYGRHFLAARSYLE